MSQYTENLKSHPGIPFALAMLKNTADKYQAQIKFQYPFEVISDDGHDVLEIIFSLVTPKSAPNAVQSVEDDWFDGMAAVLTAGLMYDWNSTHAEFTPENLNKWVAQQAQHVADGVDWRPDVPIAEDYYALGDLGKLATNVDLSHKMQSSPWTGDFIVVTARLNGKKVGQADLRFHDRHALVSEQTRVQKKFQRQGIATAMYQYAEQITGRKMVASDVQTQDGKNLWKAPHEHFGNTDGIVPTDEPLDQAAEDVFRNWLVTTCEKANLVVNAGSIDVTDESEDYDGSYMRWSIQTGIPASLAGKKRKQLEKILKRECFSRDGQELFDNVIPVVESNGTLGIHIDMTLLQCAAVLDSLFQHAEVDWRPDETIAEDYYAL